MVLMMFACNLYNLDQTLYGSLLVGCRLADIADQLTSRSFRKLWTCKEEKHSTNKLQILILQCFSINRKHMKTQVSVLSNICCHFFTVPEPCQSSAMMMSNGSFRIPHTWVAWNPWNLFEDHEIPSITKHTQLPWWHMSWDTMRCHSQWYMVHRCP